MRREGVPAETELVIDFEADKPQDECGVLAVYAPGQLVGRMAYDALQRLQHRGQSGAGIAYPINAHDLIVHQGEGLIDRAIPEVIPGSNGQNSVDAAEAPIAIGHARYSTADSNDAYQPFLGQESEPTFALAHNGHIETINEVAEAYGIDTDEVISDSWLLTKIYDKRASELGSLDEAIAEVSPQLEGAYSLVMTDGQRIIGVRDPWGTHPLALGELSDQRGYVLASEAVAFKTLEMSSVRDIEPGEIVTIDHTGVHSSFIERDEPRSHCMFEYGYIARPESVLDGVNVYRARKNMGKYLAIDQSVEADAVVGVPNSGLSAAAGYARQAKIPQVLGLFKDEYVGRSFIEREGRRDDILRRKLSVNSEELAGRDVILVDDSLIKGNTMRALVGMIREATGPGTKVHVRLAMPRYEYPCYGGMDTRQTHRLIARGKTDEEIAQVIGADSVGFNTVERVAQSINEAETAAEAQIRRIGSHLCTACTTGKYPYHVPETPDQEIDLVKLAASAA